MKHLDLQSSKKSFFSSQSYTDIQQFMEKMPYTIMLLDAQGRVAYINEWGEKMYQCTLDAVHLRPISDLLFLSDPAVLVDALAVAYQGKVVFDLQWREEQYYEGRILWREVTLVPFSSESGEVETVMVTIRDVTEYIRAQTMLIKSREEYRMIFESAPVAIILVERGVIRGFNPAWKQLSGYSQEDLVGARLERIIPHEQGEDGRTKLDAILTRAQSGNVQSLPLVWKKKNGDSINTHVTCGLVSHKKGETPGALLEVIIREV